MRAKQRAIVAALLLCGAVIAFAVVPSYAQLTDVTRTPNPIGEGICKSFPQQVGAGRGNVFTPGSSIFIINRDPFRSVRRGRQVFQRKFARSQGQGPAINDAFGDIAANPALGAGLGDSCAACHGRPRGSAGHGGDVFTRPDSRDSPHLFGLGLKEMLADEMTKELRQLRANAIAQAMAQSTPVTVSLDTKGVNFGKLTAFSNGSVDTSNVEGVNTDLRIRPFRLDGRFIAIREFVIDAFNGEMGLQAVDPDTLAASLGLFVTTPSGMELNGKEDVFQGPPVQNSSQDGDGDGVANEIPTSIVDFEEHYLLNYFLAGRGELTDEVEKGASYFKELNCTRCHVPEFKLQRDRRVASTDTNFEPNPAVSNPFNRLFVKVTPQFHEVNDGTGHPTLKVPNFQSFHVQNLFTDFKRHDLGPNFHEIQFDGTVNKQFLTMALHGVGTTAPYGHDGRSATLMDVILRHGGAAKDEADKFAGQSPDVQNAVIAFLQSLVLFPPDDTPSTLQGITPDCVGLQRVRDNLCFDPLVNTSQVVYPQCGHGSIKLGVLFNNPSDPE
ncbi:MAG: di-heme oxidoredictase family protein [Pyrinomonadaceae bacterium]